MSLLDYETCFLNNKTSKFKWTKNFVSENWKPLSKGKSIEVHYNANRDQFSDFDGIKQTVYKKTLNGQLSLN